MHLQKHLKFNVELAMSTAVFELVAKPSDNETHQNAYLEHWRSSTLNRTAWYAYTCNVPVGTVQLVAVSCRAGKLDQAIISERSRASHKHKYRGDDEAELANRFDV